MLNIDPEEYTDDESEPAGGGRAETSPMAMTPDRPSQAASRGESVPVAKVRELEEGFRRATFRDKDVAGTSENLEAVEALFEGSDLSDFLGRGKDLITPADPPSLEPSMQPRGTKSKRDGTSAGALMRSPPRRADDDDGIAKSPARKAPLVEYIDTEDDGDALAQLPRATDPAEEIDAAEMEAESTTTMEPVAGPAPTVTDYTARADQLLAFLASKGLTTDHAHAVAACESSHGHGPRAIEFLLQNNYLRPASRT